ncbi:hypothetical protein D3C73_1189200 [compost metagenome]
MASPPTEHPPAPPHQNQSPSLAPEPQPRPRHAAGASAPRWPAVKCPHRRCVTSPPCAARRQHHRPYPPHQRQKPTDQALVTATFRYQSRTPPAVSAACHPVKVPAWWRYRDTRSPGCRRHWCRNRYCPIPTAARPSVRTPAATACPPPAPAPLPARRSPENNEIRCRVPPTDLPAPTDVNSAPASATTTPVHLEYPTAGTAHQRAD